MSQKTIKMLQQQRKEVNSLPKLFPNFKNEKFAKQLESIEREFHAEHDEDNKVSNITIYGVIGDSWWRNSISASDIDRELKAAGDNDIIIRLNSPGGDAFDGVSIYNRLKDHKGKVTVYIDGYACSAASLIPLAADEVIMGIGAMVMIHEASTIVWGTKSQMRKEAGVLEKLESGIIDIYMTVAKVEREEIETMVNNETWFTAEESVAIGFANKVTEVKKPEKEDDKKKDEDPEAYKNNVLARFMNKKEPAEPKNNLLNNFKRGSKDE